jgi:hypothetical protein
MTLTTLITANAILAGAVVFAIVWLLGSAVRAERAAAPRQGASAEPAHLPADVERVAA